MRREGKVTCFRHAMNLMLKSSMVIILKLGIRIIIQKWYVNALFLMLHGGQEVQKQQKTTPPPPPPPPSSSQKTKLMSHDIPGHAGQANQKAPSETLKKKWRIGQEVQGPGGGMIHGTYTHTHTHTLTCCNSHRLVENTLATCA